MDIISQAGSLCHPFHPCLVGPILLRKLAHRQAGRGILWYPVNPHLTSPDLRGRDLSPTFFAQSPAPLEGGSR